MYQEFAQLIFESQHLLTEAKKQEYDRQGNYLFISEIYLGGASSSAPSQGSTAASNGDGSATPSGQTTNIEGPAAVGSTTQQRGGSAAPGSIPAFTESQMKLIEQIIR